MTNKDELEGIRVKSAVADKNQLTLYLEDGSIKTIKQGDPRLPRLIDQIVPIVQRGEIAVINLNTFSVFATFEEKTNGVVKFFKVAKKSLKGLFGFGKPDEPQPEEIVLTPMSQNLGQTAPEVAAKLAGQIKTGVPVPGVAAAPPVEDQQGTVPVKNQPKKAINETEAETNIPVTD